MEVRNMSDSIKKNCKLLRLAYVADIFDKIPFENPEQYVLDLFEQELALRETVKGERLIKKAKFINHKELSDYRWDEHIRFPPHLDRSTLEALHFIERKENVILTGSPGTGKSHLVTALGHKACRNGYEVRFYRVADLVDQLEKSWRDGKFQAFRNKFNKVDLIILDELCKASHNSSYGKSIIM